jgi:fumarate hydratase subunit alpha
MTVRILSADSVRDAVERLFRRACVELPAPVRAALEKAREREDSPLAEGVLGDLIENCAIASEEGIPLCQDCGQAVLFADLGQEVRFEGGDLNEAIREGVRRAYLGGYLRKSVVLDPLFDRKNSGDNTPPVVHWRIVPGDRVRLSAAPKGMGSENMSRIGMLKPSDGVEGVLGFVVETVRLAGPNPCPPTILGVGIGGTFESCALTAKRALLRSLGEPNPDPRYAELEARILAECNRLGIGPAGYGGRATVLGVHLEPLPTHIAGMPVAVNCCCWACRHAEEVL